MIAAIAWKEWRQQVALVIAILALAGIVLAATAMTMPHEWAMRSGHISNGIMWVVLLIGLAFTQGLVTGAMLFAGETEERTQEFLDQHIGLRSPLWRAKMLSGVSLVGASSVVLGGLIVVLDLGDAFLLAACVWIALDAMVWSALCSVNRKSTFGAIGVALVALFIVDGFTLAFLFNDDSRIAYFVVKIPLLRFAVGVVEELPVGDDFLEELNEQEHLVRVQHGVDAVLKSLEGVEGGERFAEQHDGAVAAEGHRHALQAEQ